MKIFWSFARQHFHSTAIYRFDFWLRVSSILILMYGTRWLWIALYNQRPGAFGVSLSQMVTYMVMSVAITNLFFTGPPYYMAGQVRTGAIDGDLLKPMDFHFHMLARSTGEMIFRIFTIAIPGMLAGYFFFDLQLPASAQTWAMFIVAFLFGYLVNFELEFLLGAVAILTIEIHSIDWAFHATSRFFSGQYVPLWLFPGFLGTLATVLPFRSIFFIPLSIYTGAMSGSIIMQAILFQIVWVIILWVVSRWVWGRVQLRLISQGG
jgi:viologen exporter family transport system permease protein